MNAAFGPVNQTEPAGPLAMAAMCVMPRAKRIREGATAWRRCAPALAASKRMMIARVNVFTLHLLRDGAARLLCRGARQLQSHIGNRAPSEEDVLGERAERRHAQHSAA